jgi:hypothetical protein
VFFDFSSCRLFLKLVFLAVAQVLIFKLEEEEESALLLHLPKLLAEDCFFASAAGLGCCLVVAAVQAR